MREAPSSVRCLAQAKIIDCRHEKERCWAPSNAQLSSWGKGKHTWWNSAVCGCCWVPATLPGTAKSLPFLHMFWKNTVIVSWTGTISFKQVCKAITMSQIWDKTLQHQNSVSSFCQYEQMASLSLWGNHTNGFLLQSSAEAHVTLRSSDKFGVKIWLYYNNLNNAKIISGPFMLLMKNILLTKTWSARWLFPKTAAKLFSTILVLFRSADNYCSAKETTEDKGKIYYTTLMAEKGHFCKFAGLLERRKKWKRILSSKSWEGWYCRARKELIFLIVCSIKCL